MTLLFDFFRPFRISFLKLILFKPFKSIFGFTSYGKFSYNVCDEKSGNQKKSKANLGKCENPNLLCACSMASWPSLFKVNNGITRAVCNLLSANPSKWANTLKQFVGSLPTNYLSVFDQFGGWCL